MTQVLLGIIFSTELQLKDKFKKQSEIVNKKLIEISK